MLRIADSPLDRLRNRKPPAVTGDQYYAGSRLAADWYNAHPRSSCTLDLARTIVDNGAAQLWETERMVAAQTRYERALGSLCRKHGMILQCCVITEESLESFGHRIYGYRNTKHARLVALNVLQDALDALIEQYHGSKRSGGGIRAAHEPDYRPRGLVPDG